MSEPRPLPLKLIGRPVRLQIWKIVLWRIFKRPLGLWMHIEVIIDPSNPFVIDYVQPRFAGAHRDPAWDEGFMLTPEPRRVSGS